LYLGDFSGNDATVCVIYAFKDESPDLVPLHRVLRFDDGNLVERRYFLFELPHPNYVEPVQERFGIGDFLRCRSVKVESDGCRLGECAFKQ
jgi:hypothetical protein